MYSHCSVWKKLKMKLFKFSILIIFLIPYTFSYADEKEREPLYNQLNRAIIRLEHIERIIQEGSKDIITKNVPDGTAFFVCNEKSLFLVSARHVVEKPYDLHARVQCINKRTGKLEVILLTLPRSDWIYHNNTGDKNTNYVDVATMKINWIKDRSIKCFNYEPEKSVNFKKNQLPYEDPDPPNPILVFGFPANVGFELMAQKPIGRFGIISMKAEKEFLKCKDKFIEGKCCLIDARMFPGNSGSPVINQPRLGASKIKLLGLVIATNNALDFGIIEPVSRIRECIDLVKNMEASGRWKSINKQSPNKANSADAKSRGAD